MKYFTMIAISSLMVLSLAACEQDGPAENAGEAIDDAAEDVQDAVE